MEVILTDCEASALRIKAGALFAVDFLEFLKSSFSRNELKLPNGSFVCLRRHLQTYQSYVIEVRDKPWEMNKANYYDVFETEATIVWSTGFYDRPHVARRPFT